MSREIARDMERKIGDVVRDTLRREIAIAQHVLEPAEIVMCMVQVAHGALSSAAATMAGVMPESDREATFVSAVDTIATMAKARWPDAKAEIEHARAEMRQ